MKLVTNPRIKKLITSILPFISVGLLLIAGETVLRLYHLARWNIHFFGGQLESMGDLSSLTLDPRLGWRATENYHFKGQRSNADRTTHSVDVHQDRNGFRMFGDVSSNKPRVFVIGDSITQAIDASDDKTYYAVLKQLLDVDVFAYGQGGYGSLQEFMVFDKYFDVIKPDLVIWQYTTNDLINNSHDLELASTINNNGMTRPYWVDGRIRYILPEKYTTRLRSFSIRHCRICYTILNRFDMLLAAADLTTVETQTSIDGPARAIFEEAARTTDAIMKRVRERAGSIPIVSFIALKGEPYGPEYEEALYAASRHNNILWLDVEAAIVRQEAEGMVVRAGDGVHWNEVAHRIAGQELADSLRNLLPKRAASPGSQN